LRVVEGGNGTSAMVDIDVRVAAAEAAPPSPPRTRSGPIQSLDGLRAFAVLIVVVSHAGYGETIPGGLGVTVFFFLSGFLITTLLVDEHDRHGGINIKHFYMRRGYRLLPPLFILLAIAYALVGLGLLDGGFSWLGISSQTFYFANYYEIFSDHVVRPNGTGILWSLAVEEHFYFLYPVVMFLALRFLKDRRVLIAIFVALCVLALAWRFYLVSQPGFEMNRTYYATDTRFDSLLFGCILALWRNPARLPEQPVSDRRRSLTVRDWAIVAGGIALLLFTILYRGADFRESLRYTLQGIALMPLFYYAIRYATTGPYRLLNVRWLARIGVLSYGVYLSHFVVLEILQTNVHRSIPSPVRLAIALGIALLFASLVDRFVDPYFRRRRAALH
jgi:peptidoglycan/LPS O-acetylase OafA/YrhL